MLLPVIRFLTRINVLECFEYSKYVYIEEKSPILSINAKSSPVKISKCGIVETKLIIGGERVDSELEFPHMVSCDCISVD